MSSPGGATPVVDAHHHLWPAEAIAHQGWRPPDDEAIRRPFGADEFRAELASAGVDGSILLQSVDDAAENDRLFRYAADNPFVLGVVGWAPLPEPAEAATVLRRLLDREDGSARALVGVRCLVGTDPMGWARTDAGLTVFRMLAAAGLAWDTVPITREQVETVCRVAAAVPDLRIVVDHLAAPPLTGDGRQEWLERITALAGFDSVAVKLSVGIAVLSRWDAWDPAALAPYLTAALDVFGPRRAMLASNWPVALLRAPFGRVWREMTEMIRGRLDDAELARVRGGTALEWYGLAPGRRR